MTEQERMQMLMAIIHQNEVIAEMNWQIVQLLVPIEEIDGDEMTGITLQ